MIQVFNNFFNSFDIEAGQIADLAVYLPLVVMIVAVSAFIYSLLRQQKQERHNKMVRQIVTSARSKRPGLTQEEIQARLTPRSSMKNKINPLMSIFELLLKLVNFNRKETEKKLIQAGDRDPRAISRYIIQRGVGMVMAPVLIWMAAPYLGLEGILQSVLAVGGILAGGILVDTRLDKALSRRRSKISVEMPVLLDLLTIYLEAGQPLDSSLGRASRALEKSFPSIAEEAGFLIRDLDMSVDREKTLTEFAQRLNTTTATTFVTIVVQSERRGNAVAPSLRVLAKEARKEVIMDIERKAQKLPTMMQLPMFLFILPAIFASVIGPAAIQIMQTFSQGIIPGAGG
jgi:tight adherence protein C